MTPAPSERAAAPTTDRERSSCVQRLMTRRARVAFVLAACLCACGGGDKKEKTTPDKAKPA